MNNFSKLTIHHNIRLSKEERYFLQEKEHIIELIGVSVPVWCDGQSTNEPAREVFCRYVLKNLEKDVAIKILEDGYVIVLPNDIKKVDGLILPDDHKKPYHQSYKNLLDLVDRGGKSLHYREKNIAKYHDRTITIMHYVNISDEESTDT